MKEYYAVDGNDVRVIRLRETPKFLISEGASLGKFKKKSEITNEIIASNRSFSNWAWSGYDIYELTAEHPKRVIKAKKERSYILEVKRELEERIKQIKTFDEALSLNDLLDLGVKHPHSK